MSDFITLTIDCLRHGRCEGPEQTLRGRADVALTAAGRDAMLAAGRRLTPAGCIITSPLARCRAVADALAAEWGTPLECLADIAEMDFGDWDGVPTDTLLEHDRERLEAFWHDPAQQPPPQGEHYGAFLARIERGWQSIIALAMAHRVEHLLVCSHAGVIKSWVALRLGMATSRARHLYKLQLPYAGVVRFQVSINQRSGERFEQLCRVC
ncbi:histidine phosphatase family protein [Kushneria aurantia]|uniref:phosphoglycerate mutase (2,3-diphosphoglycerate-dependent) n=1 Tax=Kushneria aurantia TaxID=504092 RepID=A0ABV6G6D0_9GAMM|nr:histidine phosphatase family protein [Kushneria aurantia]